MNASRYAHPLDAIIPDPADRKPICDEAEFSELLDEMVAEDAPRVFAVIQEYGDRVDAHIAAWGMAFDDHAVVASADGERFQTLTKPEHAVRLYTRGTRVSSRLVWVYPSTEEDRVQT
jgi:hypothetical protein